MTKNRPIQIMIAFAVFSVICLIAVQVYWVSLAIDEQEETFDHNVRMSLRSVADNMCQIDGNDLITDKPIDRVASNYFIARLQYNIDVKTLERLISNEFEEREILQDYEYGVYNCENDRMVFGNQVSLTGSRNEVKMPKLDEDEYYFGVYFPNKKGGLLAEMNVWKYLTFGTAVMIAFFSYGLVVVLKQKRLTEIQKDFMDNITHELKTPIATLKLTSDALVNAKDVRPYINIIAQETDRLESQVEQILQASVVEKASREMEKLDLGLLTSQVVSRFQMAHPTINWEVKLDESISTTSNFRSVEMVLSNLLDNAIKYGGGYVGVELMKKNGNVLLEIQDDGPGIPDKYKKRIFDKFFRVPSDDVHDVKGYGLGMYLVKTHLERIGGKIAYTRSDGRSKFVVKLPIK